MDEYTPADFWLEAAVVFGLALTAVIMTVEYTGLADAVVTYIDHEQTGSPDAR